MRMMTLIAATVLSLGCSTTIPHPAVVVQLRTEAKPAVVQPVVQTKWVGVQRFEYEETVQFAVNSSTLNDGAAKALADVAARVKGVSGATYSVEVSGHASSDGPAKANEVLACNRAEAVKAALVSAGLDSLVITTACFGSSVPVASNKTLAGRVQNRRATMDLNATVVRVHTVQQ